MAVTGCPVVRGIPQARCAALYLVPHSPHSVVVEEKGVGGRGGTGPLVAPRKCVLTGPCCLGGWGGGKIPGEGVSRQFLVLWRLPAYAGDVLVMAWLYDCRRRVTKVDADNVRVSHVNSGVRWGQTTGPNHIAAPNTREPKWTSCQRVCQSGGQSGAIVRPNPISHIDVFDHTPWLWTMLCGLPGNGKQYWEDGGQSRCG